METALPTPTPIRPYLTVEEAADRTGIPTRTVYRRILTGHINADRYGRGWLVPADQLAVLLAIGKRPSGRKRRATDSPRNASTAIDTPLITQ